MWRPPKLKLKSSSGQVKFNAELKLGQALPAGLRVLDEDRDHVSDATSNSFADGMFIEYNGDVFAMAVPQEAAGKLAHAREFSFLRCLPFSPLTPAPFPDKRPAEAQPGAPVLKKQRTLSASNG
jgi:hypothetical protein